MYRVQQCRRRNRHQTSRVIDDDSARKPSKVHDHRTACRRGADVGMPAAPDGDVDVRVRRKCHGPSDVVVRRHGDDRGGRRIDEAGIEHGLGRGVFTARRQHDAAVKCVVQGGPVLGAGNRWRRRHRHSRRRRRWCGGPARTHQQPRRRGTHRPSEERLTRNLPRGWLGGHRPTVPSGEDADT